MRNAGPLSSIVWANFLASGWFVHCYFLSCYFFSYLPTVSFFPVTLFILLPKWTVTFFPVSFFPTCPLLLSFLLLFFLPETVTFFPVSYFPTCPLLLSFLLLSFLLPFFLLLSFRAPSKIWGPLDLHADAGREAHQKICQFLIAETCSIFLNQVC